MVKLNNYPQRLRVEVLSLGTTAFLLENVSSLTIKLEDGSFLGILPKHAPLIAATGEGVLRYADHEGNHELNVKAGILTVKNNLVSILTTQK